MSSAKKRKLAKGQQRLDFCQDTLATTSTDNGGDRERKEQKDRAEGKQLAAVGDVLPKPRGKASTHGR